jgi:hypothetical protein
MDMPKIDTTSFLPSRQAEAYAKGKRPGNPSTAATEGSPVAPQPPRGDRAEISAVARDLVDLRAAVDAGRSALEDEPDVRASRIAKARERIAEGHYQSAEVRSQTAQKLGSVMEGLETL